MYRNFPRHRLHSYIQPSFDVAHIKFSTFFFFLFFQKIYIRRVCMQSVCVYSTMYIHFFFITTQQSFNTSSLKLVFYVLLYSVNWRQKVNLNEINKLFTFHSPLLCSFLHLTHTTLFFPSCAHASQIAVYNVHMYMLQPNSANVYTNEQ